MKYFIYRCNGGFAHNLTGLKFAIDISKQHNLILLIDYSYSLYTTTELSDYFSINENIEIRNLKESSILNDKIRNVTVKDIIKNPSKIIKGHYYINDYKVSCKTTLYNLLKDSKNEICIFTGTGSTFPNIKLFDKYINNIKDEFKDLLLLKKNYISIHYRNTDIKNNINYFIEKINEINNKYKINNVFIATDDKKSIDEFIKNTKNIHFFYVNNIIQVSGNLHYGEKDKKKLLFDMLNDIYIILNSSYFIPSCNSGLSRWIIKMINTNENIFNIIHKCKVYS